MDLLLLSFAMWTIAGLCLGANMLMCWVAALLWWVGAQQIWWLFTEWGIIKRD
jgi:hypothetical protein